MEGNILHFPISKNQIKNTTIGEVLFDRMKKYGEQICQIEAATGESETFNQLLTKSIRVAQHLKKKNLTREDNVMLCAHNSFNSSTIFLSCILLGIKISPIDPKISKEDCQYFMKIIKPKIIFCDLDCAKSIDEDLNHIGIDCQIVVFGESKYFSSVVEYLKPTGVENEFQPAKVDKNDAFTLAFSSGTTGLPKAALITHDGLLSKYCMDPQFENVTKIILFVTSFCWISATSLFVYSILFGHIRILCKNLEGDALLRYIQKYKVTYVFNNLYHSYNLIKNSNIQDYDLSSVKVMVIGGIVLREEMYQSLKSVLPNTCIIVNGYGLTETSGQATCFTLPEELTYLLNKPRSVGRGHPGCSFKVEDVDTGKLLGPNKIGEICIKGNGIFKGYYNDPESTKAMFDTDNFLHTGDLGYYDEDKCFYVIGRFKEMFKYRSLPIHPTELESVLLTHPDVKEAAVIGFPHEQDGERPVGIVVLKEGVASTNLDILKFINEKLSEGKRLHKLKIIKHLPYTSSGKLKRRYLQQLDLEI